MSTIALVTGASSGIGREIARLLGPDATTLIVVARRRDRLQSLADALVRDHPSLTVDVRTCDLSNVEATDTLIADVLAAHGRVDVLVNNAGLGQLGLVVKSDPAQLQRMLMVNVVALTALTRAFLPGMVERGQGGILNVSSGFGITWMPLFSAYVGTKHYVTAFTESLRAELAGTGVRITQLCPGPVATEFEANLGNPTGLTTPSFVEISAERCARAGVRGLRRGRAMVIPGFVAWIGITLGERSPRWLLRGLYGLAMRFVRPRLKPAPPQNGRPGTH
jgi:uncharacterized protein